MGTSLDEKYIISSFSPLEPALDAIMCDLCTSGTRTVSTRHPHNDLNELEMRGYICNVISMFDGQVYVDLTYKGRQYLDNRTAWLKFVRQREASSKRHDFFVAIIGGVFVIIGALLGWFIGTIGATSA